MNKQETGLPNPTGGLLPLLDAIVRGVSFYVFPALIILLVGLSLFAWENPYSFGPGSFHTLYMLEGGILTLSLTLILFSVLIRKWLYVLFAGWLVSHLRITSLSMGWDTQWLGHTVPEEILPFMRQLTCGLYFILTFALFTELFKKELRQLKLQKLVRAGMIPGVILMVGAFALPYAAFTALLWWMAAIGILIALYLVVRIHAVNRSPDILLYSAAMLIVIATGSGAFEKLDVLFNIRFFSNAYIHVAATGISSLLIALVITESERNERSKAIKELVALADHDPLTNTLNQRGVDKQIGEALEALKSDEPFALGYLDLGSLKTVNDLYGHTTGDDVLQQVCKMVRESLQSIHKLGRIGGSELILLFRNTTIEEAAKISTAIMQRLKSIPFDMNTRSMPLKASMGLVEVVNPNQKASDAILAAARACRLARRSGNPSQLVVHSDEDLAEIEQSLELQLLREFSTGFSTRNLFLAMQPILSLKNPLESLDFEVLLRMRDDNEKLVPTSAIIAAAEEAGVVPLLDKWVVETTLEWLDRHQSALETTQFVCVNLNGMSLNDPSFIQDFFNLLLMYEHVANLLCIEITESIAIKDMDNIRKLIGRMQAMGVRVALDDFGAGYTSFSYLKNLPADAIKIDGSFIKSMTAHPADVAIVEAIVALAHNLGMRSIAEWVEDQQTLETLARLGVDYIQGYHIAAATTPETILKSRSSSDFIKDKACLAYLRKLDTANQK